MSLPIPKKEFKPAWGHVATERNYGEQYTCNAAQAGDMTGNNPYAEDNGQVAGAPREQSAGVPADRSMQTPARQD